MRGSTLLAYLSHHSTLFKLRLTCDTPIYLKRIEPEVFDGFPEHSKVLPGPPLPARTKLWHAIYAAKPVSQNAIRAYPGIYRFSLEVVTDS